jgi:26S proteasome regulatory subunit N8
MLSHSNFPGGRSSNLLYLPVPFEEDDKDPSVWFLDHNYVESMNDMFKKVNAREKLIGWYHSGPKLRASDLEINELFKRYTPNPLLVIIDVQPKESGVPTDAYFAVEEIKDVSRLYSHTNMLQSLCNPRMAGDRTRHHRPCILCLYFCQY